MVRDFAGGRSQVFRGTDLAREEMLEDVCGVAAKGARFIVTTGAGLVLPCEGPPVRHALAWDNHLIAI